ncbi:thiamin pyrophosphokinase 1-like [Limulus polyphemus]|uniref:Thiamin pyrophosphokinase 1-like n=1 Tax=Limulus polyphemus TaxID=6850 RepID=A0ABM1BNE6_LIMPO|nr:thiamin pyrophosphokinase 1-like [Limulus polyphemus]
MNSNYEPSTSKEWQPLKILSENSGNKNAVILLNQPFDEQVEEKVKKLWKSAVLRVAVDGGAKYIYNVTGNNREDYIPHIVTGDFDSINLPVLEFYKKKACRGQSNHSHT